MTWNALRNRKPMSALAAMASAALIAAVLGTGSLRAQMAGANPYADRFPNVVLKTHEGRNVRFYHDLLKGKIVLINFFYATCQER